MSRKCYLIACALMALVLGASSAHATLVALMSFDDTVKASTYVVKGTVTAKEPGWIVDGAARVPVTRYTLTIDTAYLGEDAPTSLTLTNPGGVQLSPELYAPMPEGFIDYPIGTTMAVMLSPTGKGTYAPAGLHQGIYYVTRDKATGAVSFERAAGTATVVNHKAAPAQPLFAKTVYTEAEFEQALSAAAKASGKSLRAIRKPVAGGAK